MEQYKNDDGTYTSPKNNKVYKSLKAFRAHWYYAGTTDPDSFSKRLYDVSCKHCSKSVIVSNISRHEKTCYLNPVNIQNCKSCGKPIKNYKYNKGTCSYSCSNRVFNKDRKKPENYKKYTSICWHYHKKECIICGEEKIVAVHHFNENRDDNRPENLVPLCPTHHSYIHSRYKHLILDKVNKYIEEFKLRLV